MPYLYTSFPEKSTVISGFHAENDNLRHPMVLRHPVTKQALSVQHAHSCLFQLTFTHSGFCLVFVYVCLVFRGGACLVHTTAGRQGAESAVRGRVLPS